ncbi:vasorin isoform X2 [Rhinatrema bivittatum]|nr:vasorin isoform X2 [Rhinatrema bivittatum]XP_029432467.1 vasorin isoform X2 [Rhinatrema bivittatum]
MNHHFMCTVFLVLSQGVFMQGCPTGCLCNQPQTVFCMSRRSQAIPKGLPQDTASLYLFENGITALDEDSFFGFPGLQLLDLSQNKIASLQKNVFQPVSNLSNLDLSSNLLQEITNETFYGLHLLERLYLEGNRIQYIHPSAFDTLESLLELKLQKNKLHSVPQLNLPQLLLLDLSWNQIPLIKSGTFHTINIESLKVAGLGLTTLDEELFQEMRNLHELDISDNQLDKVPSTLQQLNGLTKLSLAGNAKISLLQVEDFSHLNNLQELDISNINLNTIPKDFFSFSLRLKTLTVAENPFNCICQLSWFVQWAQENGVELRRSEETRCHFPPKNAGKLLKNLEYMDFGCPTTTTTVRTTPKPVVLVTNSRFSLSDITTVPPPKSTAMQENSTPGPGPALESQTSPPIELCPPQTCLNGGTCQLDAHGYLDCACLEGFSGLYCEVKVKTTTPPITKMSTPTNQIRIKEVTGTSLKVDLHSYIDTRPLLKGIRLTYRNLSGPDKRPITLSLPASLPDYTVRALRPNSTYHICIGPLGDRDLEDVLCLEAQTAWLTQQQHAPVTQTKNSNLTLMIVPALAAVLLVIIAVATAMYYIRKRRSKAHTNAVVDLGPLQLEGVKTFPENGTLTNHTQKLTGSTPLPNGLECEVPLMQTPSLGNNNTTVLKPSYF